VPFKSHASTPHISQGVQVNKSGEPARLPALLSVPRAAAILGLSRASAYRYAASGELPTKRLGGRVYIITAQIRSLIDGTEELAA
jgi:predicted DNA-binding transcriptional regulator AlpA